MSCNINVVQPLSLFQSLIGAPMTDTRDFLRCPNSKQLALFNDEKNCNLHRPPANYMVMLTASGTSKIFPIFDTRLVPHGMLRRLWWNIKLNELIADVMGFSVLTTWFKVLMLGLVEFTYCFGSVEQGSAWPNKERWKEHKGGKGGEREREIATIKLLVNNGHYQIRGSTLFHYLELSKCEPSYCSFPVS